MKFRVCLVSIVALGALMACGKDRGEVREAWDAVNDPLRLAGGYQRNLGNLPLSAELSVKPWSDSYWPTKEGGIAVRWFGGTVTPFTYQTHSEAQVRAMRLEQLRSLSPAEKYDIAMGRFDYPTVASERRRTSPNAASWEGICHGWGPAAIHYGEPGAVEFVGPSGIRVPFSSADVKALLALLHADGAPKPARLLGGRCNVDFSRDPSARNNPECRDTNAGSFHIVLVNQIALFKKSFMLDVTTDYEVWNQPVHAFTSRVIGFQAPSPGAATGTQREAVVQTTIRYTVENSPTVLPVLGTANQKDSQKTYQYRLELNAQNEVIGGAWISADRPDFLWTQEPSAFEGKWKTLGDLYSQSRGGLNPPTPVPTPTATALPLPSPTTTPPVPVPQPSVTPTEGPQVDPIQAVDEFNNPDQLRCGLGFELQVQRQSKAYLCTKDDKVAQGSVTSQMRLQCQSSQEQGCDQAIWTVQLALKHRGQDGCPLGASKDKETGYCREGSDLIGPFKHIFIERCLADARANGQGEQVCFSVRLKKDFVVQTLTPRG